MLVNGHLIDINRSRPPRTEIFIPLTDYNRYYRIKRARTHEVKVVAIYKANVTNYIECNLYNTY